MQLAEVELLKDVVQYLDANDIRYFIMSGTLLGAVRHKGFIPWDDDIDLAVPRPDYDRLLALSDNNNEIKVKTFLSDKSYNEYFGKIESNRIIVHIVNRSSDEIEEKSSWVSLFPFDGMPNNAFIRKVHKMKILYFRMLYVMARFDQLANLKKKRKSKIERLLILFTVKFHMQNRLSKKKTFDKIDRLLKRYEYDKSDYVVDAMGAYKFKEMFPRSWFGEGQEYVFETLSLHGPSNYDDMLTQLYGDYMTPVDANEREGHYIKDIIIKR